MKMKSLASILLPAALAVAALPASALSVTSVGLAVSPAASKGPCPVEFTFTGKVVLNGRGSFTYKWERGDGGIDSTAPHTATYDGVNPAIVKTTWTLGAAMPLFHPFDPAKSTQTLHILTPTDASKTARFHLDCGPGRDNPNGPTPGNPTGGPGHPNPNCDGKPDLVPVLHTPMDGWVQVKNVGDGNAGPSRLLIKCVKEGHTGPGGGCAELPASAIAPPFFSTPDALGLTVPAIACHGEFHATMPWWPNLKWAKGTYHFTATADVGNTVAESNEGNNQATSTLVK
ncbi:MAG: CARDB domain-containing protein [Acidobacteriota bacterium]